MWLHSQTLYKLIPLFPIPSLSVTVTLQTPVPVLPARAHGCSVTAPSPSHPVLTPPLRQPSACLRACEAVILLLRFHIQVTSHVISLTSLSAVTEADASCRARGAHRVDVPQPGIHSLPTGTGAAAGNRGCFSLEFVLFVQIEACWVTGGVIVHFLRKVQFPTAAAPSASHRRPRGLPLPRTLPALVGGRSDGSRSDLPLGRSAMPVASARPLWRRGSFRSSAHFRSECLLPA